MKMLNKSETKESSIQNDEVFYDTFSDKIALDGNQQIKFIKSSLNVSFKVQFFEKFNDLNIWKVLIGSFCCGVFVRYDWLITAIITFVALISSYIDWDKSEKLKAVEYCARKISKNPERFKQFLATVSAPQNLNSGKSGDDPCEWINDILSKFWPYINGIAQSRIDAKGFSKTGIDVGNGHIIYFERFTLGDKPPAISSIHVKKTSQRKDEITIVLKIIYFGNCLLLFSYKTRVFLKAKAGFKDLYFRGEAVIILRPLIETPPFIGGISFCLEEPPLIDYDGINLANIADIQIFKNFLLGIISSFVVSPNKLFVPLMNNPNIKRELKFPLPIGLCFIEILEAEDLPKMDLHKFLIFEGSSDTFCKLKVGSYQFNTKTIYSSLNPYFNQSFSVPIHDFDDFVKIDIFHKESISSDEFIGSIEFKLSDIKNDKQSNGRDKWLPIGKSSIGSLHFRIAVFDLSVDQMNAKKILKASKESSCKMCVAILSVYIYYVSKISSADEEENLKPAVDLKLSEQTFQTKSRKPPNNGYYYFEESSHFMCYDLEKDVLEVSVICLDSNSGIGNIGTIITSSTKYIGSYEIAVKDIIKSKMNMTLNQEFPIKKKTSGKSEVKESGFVRMFVSLKVCKYKKKLFNNLKIASSIQANIEQTLTDDTITKLVCEPISSVRNPIRSIKTIGYSALPFMAPKKKIVAEDVLPVPANLGEHCNVKVRVKWPDRTALHIEILKVIQIPLNIINVSYKYSISVKISLKTGFNQSLGEKPKFGQIVRNRLKLKNEPTDRKHLATRHTKKQKLDNFTANVMFNERLLFKLSPLNNIDNHILDFYLILHKPRKFFAVTFNSSLVASSTSSDIPTIDFKGDPIEKWYRLNFHTKF